MARKLIALASSDWHIHKFRAFDDNGSRLGHSLKAAEFIMGEAANYKVPLLHCGDLFHDPKEVENETMSRTQSLFNQADCDTYMISGNHDMSEKNSFEHRSPTHLDSFRHFPHFHKLDRNYELIPELGMYIYGIPYMNNDLDILKCLDKFKENLRRAPGFNVLMLHSDAPGAMTPEGIRINETEHIPKDMDTFFENFDLVLMGHIHKAQQLSKKVYMLGCPIHQNAGDAGNECGYWKVYTDRTLEFIPLNKFPKFVKLKQGETPYNNKDYFIEPDEVLEEQELETKEFNINTSKHKLAKRYCKTKGVKSKSKLQALIKILNDD